MIDLNLGGACPRRPITYALPRAMKARHAPLDGELGHCELGVVAANGTISEGIEVLGDIALRHGRTWLMASFADIHTTLCRGLVLLHPTDGGILIGLVEPCLVRPGAAMILVAEHRSCAFAMDAAGVFAECPVPRPAKAKEGIARGWADLKRRMRAPTTERGAFRHASWELHLMPTC